MRRRPQVSLKTGLSFSPIPRFFSESFNLARALTGQRSRSEIWNKMDKFPGGPLTFADLIRIFAESFVKVTSSQSRLENLSKRVPSLPSSSPSRKAPQKATRQQVQTDWPVNFLEKPDKPFRISQKSAMVSGYTGSLLFFCDWLRFVIPLSRTFARSQPIVSKPVAKFPKFFSSLR